MRRDALFYLVFFVAGAPALVYQTAWQRVLTLYFGVDIYSTSVTVASVMLGLGLGSLVGGRLADRVERPALLYVVAETLTGLFGAASLPLFSFVGQRLAGSSLAVVILVDFCLLLVPTALMGTTLPLMARAVQVQEAQIGRHLSRLYGLNTLGAAVGALVSAYFLIGLIGLDRTTYVAAAVNLLVGAAAWLLARRPNRAASAAPESPTVAAGRAAESTGPREAQAEIVGYGAVLALAFLSGFVALGYEIVWYRILVALLHGTVYVFGTILCFFLLGIAAGSLWSQRTIDRPGALLRFAASQAAIGAYTIVVFGLFEHLSWLPGLRHAIAASTFIALHPSPELLAGQTGLVAWYSLFDIFLWTAFVLGPPTVLMGYGFPNLMRAGSRAVETLGRSVAMIYFANILGSTLGSLVMGFVLLGMFGSEISLTTIVALGLAPAIYVFGRRLRRSSDPADRLRARRALAGSLALLVAAAVVLPWPLKLLRALHYADFDGVEFVGAEDRSGTVVLRRQDRVISFPEEERVLGLHRLHIDGAAHGEFAELSTAVGDADVELALAACPHPRRVLAIGLGDAKMCVSAASSPRVEELLIVELSGALGEVLGRVPQGADLFARSNVTLVVDDGRRWLLANPAEEFDLILMWPLHAGHAHSGNLFSREFLALVRERLTEEGLLFIRSADLYSTARTLALEYPHVLRLGRSTYLASQRPIRFDPALLPADAPPLDEYVQADRETILRATAGAPVNLDLRPNSEFYLTYPYVSSLQTWGRGAEDQAYRSEAPR